MTKILTWVWKNIKWVALGLLVVWALMATSRSCTGPNTKYWMKVAVHEQALKDAAADHLVNLAEIKVLKADNAAKDVDIQAKAGEIQKLKGKTNAAAGEILGLEGENQRLRENVQAAIDANPALQRLVANFELQITKHKEKEFSLEQRLAKVGEPIQTGVDATGKPVYVYPEKTITWDLAQQVKNEGRRADLWEADYNRSQGLLGTERSLRLTSEKKWKRTSLVAKAEAAVIVGGASYMGGKALGHALKLW